jgi:scyllo-inositol 2-dehydrogenase (NADP+)
LESLDTFSLPAQNSPGAACGILPRHGRYTTSKDPDCTQADLSEGRHNAASNEQTLAPQPLNAGLIGFGFAGRTFHAPVIRAVDGLRLAAILQRSGNDAVNAYPDVRLARTVQELLSSDSIDLVVIATPNTSHFDLARQCLLAGRHVVIDKPFATTYEEAAELVSLADKSGRVLSVYQNRRWDGDFKTVRSLVTSDALGRIALYESHFDRFRPQLRSGAWREQAAAGSGVLFDLGPHLIDQALVLFGTPDAVSADVRVERDGAVVDDAFDVTLLYSRLRVLLRASMLASTPGPRFLLHGTKSSYLKYGLDPQEDALKRGEIPGGAAWGKEPAEAWGKLFQADADKRRARAVPTEAGDYRGYYENIRDAILGKAALAVTPQAALGVMRVIELAQQSNHERRVIQYRSVETTT